MDPRGNTATVLSTRVLRTPAADPPQAPGGNVLDSAAHPGHDQSRFGGNDPRAPRGGKTAPYQKTNVGSVRPDVAAEDAKKASEQYLDLAQKGLTLLSDSVKRMASKDQREQAAFKDALGQAFAEMAKKEALGTIEKIPYAKVIIKAIKLSAVFADAAGQAIDAASEKLDYERKIREAVAAPEITPEVFRTLQFIRGWQRNSAAEVEGVLRAGLAAVVEAVIVDLFGEAEQALSKALKDVVGQVSKQLFRQNELLAIVHDMATEQANRIPETRAKLERITFHTLADTWVKLLGDEKLYERLGPVLDGIGGEEPVHVGVFAGLLEVIARGSYDEYAKHVKVAEARDELRNLCVHAARQLLTQTRKGQVQVVPGEKIEISAGKVTVPEELLKELDSSFLPPNHRRLYFQRVEEFDAAVKRLSIVHREVWRRFQEEIYRQDDRLSANPNLDPNTVLKLHERRQNQLKRLGDAAIAELAEFQQAVLKEFGPQYEDRPTLRFFPRLNDLNFRKRFFPVGLAPWRGAPAP